MSKSKPLGQYASALLQPCTKHGGWETRAGVTDIYSQ